VEKLENYIQINVVKVKTLDSVIWQRRKHV